MWSIHTTDYYIAIKGGEALTHTSIWMNLKNTMMNKSSQTQKPTWYMFSLIGNVQKKQIHRDKKQIRLPDAGQRESGVTALGDMVSFWGDRKCSRTR